ncbi:MAG: GNAT family N-acetyltransferase [Gemmatimonadaceae bacterium]
MKPPERKRGITVRCATEADLAIVTELRLALLREHSSDVIYGRVRPNVNASARRLYRAQLGSRDEVTFLARRGSRTLGILRCVHSRGYPLLLPPEYGYVSSVYVIPEARRSGVLKILLRQAEKWCRDRGLTEMRLHSGSDNALSNATWDALGFTIVEHLRMRPLEFEK